MRRILTPVLLACTALTGAAANSSAYADEHDKLPTYACDNTFREYTMVAGSDNCVASNGAPTKGDVYGDFLIRNKGGEFRHRCESPNKNNPRQPSGSAKNYPKSVSGGFCWKV
ncbi:hypothetical protein AABB02_33625 [Streptomyces rimosus]|uniref:hypothetical protein n=1 Tax=Streptomyces rimosus TaxID=1927 RepID=UPI0031D168E0